TLEFFWGWAAPLSSMPPPAPPNKRRKRGRDMHRNLFAPLLAAGSIAVLAQAAPAFAQASPEVEISLPAQDLAASLRALSLRTGRSIVVSGDLVRGRQAPAVSGSFTAEEAARRLLAGSGLEVRRIGDSLVVVAA